jgi:tripartite-type tricarboxylate transporter receptor subunit TctC
MTILTSRRGFIGGLMASTGWSVLTPTPLRAQRPVRMVVPFAPGGGADLIARMLQPHLQQILGQSFFVENRAGAAGRIGTDAVAKAEEALKNAAPGDRLAGATQTGRSRAFACQLEKIVRTRRTHRVVERRDAHP